MPATSTKMNPAYLRSAFVPMAQVTWNDQTITIPDTLDFDYQQKLATLIPIYTAAKLDNVPITSIAYKLYNNTSIFWAILAANGYIHPLAIQSGTPVGYPDINGLLTSDNTSSTVSTNNTRSTQVTI